MFFQSMQNSKFFNIIFFWKQEHLQKWICHLIYSLQITGK